MPTKKFYTKDQVLEAMRNTQSNRAAARYLGCSYQHYKKYAKLYKGEDGRTLFDIHFNQRGFGIKKHLGGDADNTPLLDIIEGRVSIKSFTIDKLKARLIKDAYMKEECAKCGFHERRTFDFRVPLILRFKNDNKEDWKLQNLELLCYNCYFLYIGNVFSDKQLKSLEHYEVIQTGSLDEVTWDLDDNQVEHLKELGLWDNDEEEDNNNPDIDDLIDFK